MEAWLPSQFLSTRDFSLASDANAGSKRCKPRHQRSQRGRKTIPKEETTSFHLLRSEGHLCYNVSGVSVTLAWDFPLGEG